MSSSSPQTSDNNDKGQPGTTIRYEFIYFNTRGAGEFCRLLLAAFRFHWQDLRYPIRLANNGGWAPGGDYMVHQRQGQFVTNLDRLPILNVVVQTGGAKLAASGPDHRRVLATATTTTIGQSHAIGRYLWRQHLRENHELRLQLSDLTLAQLDCVCECVRDIQSAWYQAKTVAEKKRTWFVSDLTRHCERLEACIIAAAANAASRVGELAVGGPFLIPGCTMPSIADVAIYHLLGTPVSLMTGSVSSFMDNEGDRVVAAYGHLPRLKTIVTSVSNLPSIRRWEEVRPDTFS
jgi:hypothetical protein